MTGAKGFGNGKANRFRSRHASAIALVAVLVMCCCAPAAYAATQSDASGGGEASEPATPAGDQPSTPSSDTTQPGEVSSAPAAPSAQSGSSLDAGAGDGTGGTLSDATPAPVPASENTAPGGAGGAAGNGNTNAGNGLLELSDPTPTPEAGSTTNPPQAPSENLAGDTLGKLSEQPAEDQPANQNQQANGGTPSSAATAPSAGQAAPANTTKPGTTAKTANVPAKTTAAPKLLLAPGTYVIVDAGTAGAVLDVYGQSKARGANVELYAWNGGGNQKWILTVDAKGRYFIKGVQSGKMLSVLGTARSGANVGLNTGSSASQAWVLRQSGSFYYLCSAANQGLVLGTPGARTSNCTNIALYSAKSSNAQRFYFIPVSAKVTGTRAIADGVYTIGMASKPKQKIDVEGASLKDCANVLAYAENGGMNQKWIVSYNGSGLYRLTSVESGLALDVEGASILARSNAIQYRYKGSANQLWNIAKNADGTYTMRSALSGMALEVAGNSTANCANVRVNYPTGAKAQRFVMTSSELLVPGTYQLFTKMDQQGRALDISGASVANGAKALLWRSHDGPNQHFIIQKVGNAYSIQVVSSGKYLTAANGKVTQQSKRTSKSGQAASQLWKVSYRGGYVFTKAADGKCLDISGARPIDGAQAITWKWNGGANQKYRLVKRPVLSNGLYTLSSAANTSLALDVTKASFDNGANLELWKANGNNNQKFWVESAGGGYYRISMLLTDSVVDVTNGSKANGANVLMWDSNNKASWQLWKPVVTDGGLTFVNKNSGMALAAAKPAAGANVRQEKVNDSKLEKWAVGATSVNFTDVDSFLKCIAQASGSSGLKISNGVAGWKVDSSKWNALQRAINNCDFGIGFIMTDCTTGMTLSYNPDRTFYGVSTIKALWTTYLFEEYLAKGRLSWGQVSGLVVPTIVDSNNQTYLSLRDSYGSESGFGSWLNRVGVDYIGTWGYYTPRTLQKTWSHMLAYSNSGRSYSGTWKSTFDHSYMSAIQDGIGGYRTVYSKPGWMSDILDDSAVVVGQGGRQYLLTVMTSAGPGGKGDVQRVVRAVDSLQASMPSHR